MGRGPLTICYNPRTSSCRPCSCPFCVLGPQEAARSSEVTAGGRRAEVWVRTRPRRAEPPAVPTVPCPPPRQRELVPPRLVQRVPSWRSECAVGGHVCSDVNSLFSG